MSFYIMQSIARNLHINANENIYDVLNNSSNSSSSESD